MIDKDHAYFRALVLPPELNLNGDKYEPGAIAETFKQFRGKKVRESPEAGAPEIGEVLDSRLSAQGVEIVVGLERGKLSVDFLKKVEQKEAFISFGCEVSKEA